MRYNNWDVLIFPETGESKTPLQEFGTICTVTQDPDVPSAPSTAHPAYLTTVTRPLPMVSCYIPSLPNGTPFRVSLHSWATPQPSRATLSMNSPENIILYEARVMLDGICIAGIWFNQDPSWPQVIGGKTVPVSNPSILTQEAPDMSSYVDKANSLGQLLFPPFHSEMLTQVWADATQNLGRVKIIIAEGIRNGQGNYGFQRLKNVVTFSFQHAPLHVLENCGIAWPNAGMWLQAQQQFYNVSSTHPDPADAEAHGHSPRRRDASTARARLEAKMVPPGNGTTGQRAFQDLGLNSNDPFWSQHGPVSDPFIGGVSFNSFYENMASCNTTGSAGDATLKSRYTSSSHDVPMPDASRPLSPASSRRSHPMPDYSEPPSLAASRKGSEYANPGTDGLGRMPIGNMLLSSKWQDELGAERGRHDSQFNEMMAAFSPLRKEFVSGISAPSNTRVNSAANTPPGLLLHPSAAAVSRALSYEDHNYAVAVTTRDPPALFTRAPSAVKSHSDSRKSDSRQSEFPDNANERVEPTIRKKPVGRPRGRKEGKTSELTPDVFGNTQRRRSTDFINAGGKENTESEEKFGDGKRKRVSNMAGFKIALEDRVGNPELLSPSRKVSKTCLQDDLSAKLGDMDELTAEGIVTRQPLGELDNLM